MLRQNKRIIIASIAVGIMLACMPAFPTELTPIPTFDSNAPLTAIVQTADAAMVQTAQFAPPTLTSTATLTRTPPPTDTATPTFIFALPTSTLPPTQIPAGSSGLLLECQILSQDPPDNKIFNKGDVFTAVWLVANVGLNNWPSDNTDYRYSSGDELHLQPIYDFEKNVSSGDTVALSVTMQAPDQVGTFSTIWQISIGQERFCSMRITIIVS